MFKIVFKPAALRQLKRIKRYDAVAILDSVERHLQDEPERTSRGLIKRLRGQQESTFRLRVYDHRVFYDVIEDRVEVLEILHKSETPAFYKEGPR